MAKVEIDKDFNEMLEKNSREAWEKMKGQNKRQKNVDRQQKPEPERQKKYEV